jgi:hypothetical protein
MSQTFHYPYSAGYLFVGLGMLGYSIVTKVEQYELPETSDAD